MLIKLTPVFEENFRLFLTDAKTAVLDVENGLMISNFWGTGHQVHLADDGAFGLLDQMDGAQEEFVVLLEPVSVVVFGEAVEAPARFCSLLRKHFEVK
jgi:hypothetical protein